MPQGAGGTTATYDAVHGNVVQPVFSPIKTTTVFDTPSAAHLGRRGRHLRWDDATNAWVRDGQANTGGVPYVSLFDPVTQRTMLLRGTHPDPQAVVHRVDWTGHRTETFRSLPQPYLSSVPATGAIHESGRTILTVDAERVWRWSMVDESPCHHFELGTSGLPERTALIGVAIDWEGSGLSTPAAVELQAWETGSWKDVAATETTQLTWSTSDAARVKRMHTDDAFRFRFRTAGPSLSGRRSPPAGSK